MVSLHLTLTTTLLKEGHDHYPHFRVRSESQRCEANLPGSHNQYVAKPGSEPRTLQPKSTPTPSLRCTCQRELEPGIPTRALCLAHSRYSGEAAAHKQRLCAWRGCFFLSSQHISDTMNHWRGRITVGKVWRGSPSPEPRPTFSCSPISVVLTAWG